VRRRSGAFSNSDAIPRAAAGVVPVYMYIYILYTIYMYHKTTPHTVAYNNIIHAPLLLYDRDDARAAVTPKTFLIDFCSRKITNFSPPPHHCLRRRRRRCRIDYRCAILLFRYCNYSHSRCR